MISLTTGEKIMVLESTEQVVERVVNFRRSITAGMRVTVEGNGVSLGETHGRT